MPAGGHSLLQRFAAEIAERATLVRDHAGQDGPAEPDLEPAPDTKGGERCYDG